MAMVPIGIFLPRVATTSSRRVWVLTFGSEIMRGPLCLSGRSGRQWQAEGRPAQRSVSFPGIGCPVVGHVSIIYKDVIHGALCCHFLQSGLVGSARRSLSGVGGLVTQEPMVGLGWGHRDFPVHHCAGRETSCV